MPGLQLLPFLSYLGKTNRGVRLPPPPIQIRVKEYIVNGLIKTISDKTLYKLYLTKILKKRFIDHHSITSK